MPLKSIAPKFDERYDHRRDNDPDKERREIKALKRELTRERRGAAKELRKDAAALARHQQAEADASEAARRKQLRDNRAWLEAQESTFNQAPKKGGGLMGANKHMTGGGSGKTRSKTRKKHIPGS